MSIFNSNMINTQNSMGGMLVNSASTSVASTVSSKSPSSMFEVIYAGKKFRVMLEIRKMPEYQPDTDTFKEKDLYELHIGGSWPLRFTVETLPVFIKSSIAMINAGKDVVSAELGYRSLGGSYSLRLNREEMTELEMIYDARSKGKEEGEGGT